MREHFEEAAALCEIYGSPFTARLIERMNADFSAGGPIATLVGQWTGAPRADAVALRLCGALHAAVLMGRDPALAAQYPAQRADWEIAAVWPAARAFLEREQTWVAEFIRSPPQTNEVRRSIALLAGFLAFAHEHRGPIDTLEIGASAGLNLNWDRFRYTTAAFTWGPASGAAIDSVWQGAVPPIDATVHVRTRAGCDLNPLDIGDPPKRLQLRSYVWADQRERLARFDAAVDLALANGVRVERADAAEWLGRKLAARATDAATIVYHSVFLQYPPPATRAAIISAIEAAGASATDAAPLAWLRLEPEAVLGGPAGSVRFLVDMVTWPGAVRRVLAFTDGHVRSVEGVQATGR
jgi:hypothetical protein